MGLKILQFLALLLTALILIPEAAHLLVLPNKLHMASAPYYTVQGIYRGWAYFGVVLAAAIIVDILLVRRLWRQSVPYYFAGFAVVILLITLAVFFIWTYPVNVLTDNWTFLPSYWNKLRIRWEYSHAVNAVLTFLAFCCVAIAVVTTKPTRPGASNHSPDLR